YLLVSSRHRHVAAMVSIPLPPFAPSHIKSKVTLERYETLLLAVSAHLRALGATDAWPFISTYLADQSLHSGSFTPGERALRKSVLELAERTIGDAGASVDALLGIAVAYVQHNSTRVTRLVDKAFDEHPEFEDELRNVAVPALSAALEPVHKANKKDDERLARVTRSIALIAQSSSRIATIFSKNGSFLAALATAYDHAPSAHLLDAIAPILQQNDPDGLFASIFPLLVKPALLCDYARITAFADQLEQLFGGAQEQDPRLGYILATLRSSDRALPSFAQERSSSSPSKPAAAPPTNGAAKGKGKAKAESAMDLQDPRVSQLADIFPDHDRTFLWRCLHHPTFNGDVDLVVGALLEGNPPPDLLEEPPTALPSPPVTERRNVFDDDDLDFSKLRIGKTVGDADELLRERADVDELKADILRRVEEMSDEEDDGGAGVDDMDDIGGVVRVRDGDADSDADGPSADERQKEIEFMLEVEYIRDPAQFARDAATRRSKGRAELREKTGWGDEQIEGWKVMLERNPQKDKILAKHEFRGNRPDPEDEDEESSEEGDGAPGQSGSRGRGRGRGRGGRGRGGAGRGGAGGGDTARDRAHKNKHKNDQRKRGHDRKMAKAA
ncbi:hypothetical protein EXIGLDRAFT_717666, partial [Exidia glandulosa HHB12029]